MFFSYQEKKSFHILSVNQNADNKYINRLFGSEPNFHIKNIKKSDFFNEKPGIYQLIILNEITDMESGFDQTLRNYLKNGGNILFVPGNKIEESVNSFLANLAAPLYTEIDSIKQRISKLEVNSNIYQDVFQELKNNARLPDVFKYYKTTNTDNSTLETIWQTAGEESLFTKIVYEKGNFYQLALNLNLEWSNVPTHPIFVPSLINLSKNSGNAQNIYLQLGKNYPIAVSSLQTFENEMQFHIVNNQLGIDVIPQIRFNENQEAVLHTKGQILHAENYDVKLNDSIIQIASFNYLREESIPKYASYSDIEDQIKALNGNISVISSEKMKLSALNHEKRSERQFWRIFILLAIGFFLSEAILKTLKT